ncbi:retrovirus-related Pol polyprotein from transposon 297 [Trichonephila clavipes]|nr:retrovirus-related Pol polyprotein from transposon 297 [Trichonephila clavipes]
MAFLGKGKKQAMLQLAEELGINATLNMTVSSIKIAITNSEGYEEEFVKNLYETIIANGKRLEELERAEKMRLEELERAEKMRLEELEIAEKMRLEELKRAEKMRLEELERADKIRLEELVKEQALKEKELLLKFDLERFKIESGFRVNDESNDSTNTCSVTSNLNFKKLIPDFDPKQSDISLYLVIFERQAKRAAIEKKEWVGQLLDNWANLKSATQIAELFDNYEDDRKVYSKPMDSPELVCLPLVVVEISGNFGTVQTKAAVCGNHLNQHGRYLLGNKTSELIKGNLGYNFLPVEILNAVQTRSQVKAAREERGIDSGEAKKGENEAIIVSPDAVDEILIPAFQEYVPELALLRVTRENLINAQKNSEEIKSLYEQAASQVQVTNQLYSLEKELLVKNREDKLGNVVKLIVVPEGLRDPIRSLCPEGTSAHLGITKSKDKLNRYFYWPNCYRDMEQFVKTCDQCQRAGKPNDKKKAPLKLVPVIQEVFTKINIDACGPLPITSKGNR